MARFAPTEVRVKSPQACRECGACEGAKEGCVNCYECFAKGPAQDRELDLRPPAIGLARPKPLAPSSTYFAILMLAGVAYNEPCWRPRCGTRSHGSTPLTQTLELFLMPLLFLAM